MRVAEPLDVAASLDRVREGLESRARRISGRVGKELADYVGRPGKMLRARFCLQLGAGLGVEAGRAESAARVVELVHNASLLHDDCVDEADLRRGEPTPNRLFGTAVGLLLGDLGFTQALEEAQEVSATAPQHLVTAVREMTVGELQEEFLKGSRDVTFDAYMGIAARKTGALFEWCGHVLAELSPHDPRPADPPRLGCAAGILLQIVDDIHDLVLDPAVSGKARGQDLRMGRLGLPAVLALQDPDVAPELTRLHAEVPREAGAAEGIARLLVRTGKIEAARERGREILRSMRLWIAALPVRGEAEALSDFIENLARREF